GKLSDAERLTGINAPIRLPCSKAYVSSVTAPAEKAESPACQGLHNALVLPYGFPHTVRWTVARLSTAGPSDCRSCRRLNVRTAGRAQARLQGKDRLEATR